MEKDGQLTWEATESVTPLGDSFKDDIDFLVGNYIMDLIRASFFAAPVEGKSRKCILHGPAGTGKTETLKEICKIIGYNCIVINCNDEMSITEIKNIFSEYGDPRNVFVFDEMNRINRETFDLAIKHFETIEISSAFLVGITINPG